MPPPTRVGRAPLLSLGNKAYNKIKLGEQGFMSFSNRDGWIWMDGTFVPWREAKVHVLTHTLHYGSGVFEGIRAYETIKGAAIFRLHEHTERLLMSAKIIGMTVPYDAKTLNDAQTQLFAMNHLAEGYIRPLAFFGSQTMGVPALANQVSVAIACWPWGKYLGEEALELGIRAKTSSFTRISRKTLFGRAKATGHYLNSMLAKHEALLDGYDEALLLDEEGFIAEGSGENVFIVKNGILYTPDLSSALPGITRDTVVTLALDLGIKLVEKRLTRDELYTADEAFFTGTAAEITPIRELDHRRVGQGKRGPITETLQTRFFACVHGELAQYAHWLTPVPKKEEQWTSNAL